MNNRNRAFSLVELLVVVAIIGTLATMLLPSIGRVMALAQEQNCNANLSVIGKAITAYHLQNKGMMPKNDDKDWGWPKSGDDVDALNYLPGAKSSMRWWCNKVYSLGHREPKLYRCSSDSLHSSPTAVVQCSYGFNDTLTDPKSKGGDGIVSIDQVTKALETFLVGHCSPVSVHGGPLYPGINQKLAEDPKYWPIGHYSSWDPEAGETLGRAGFLMAGGNVKVFSYTQVRVLTDPDDASKYRLFHKN